MRRKKLVNKTVKKKFAGKCKFCPCDIYELLDVHRIVEGKDGGVYSEANTVVACASCHRKIHAGLIKIDKYYNTISGKVVLHYWENGEEKYE